MSRAPDRRKGEADAVSRSNSIAFVRFVLASLVVLGHFFDLNHLPGEPVCVFSHGQTSFGTLAVAGFFALSGYLITRSYAHAASPWRYLWHRFLRIMPGYWICLLVTGLVLGPLANLLEYGTLAGYVGRQDWTAWTYIRSNALLTINTHRIGDIFARNPLAYTVNDSLWTLEVEFRCYLGVMLLGAFRFAPGASRLLPAVPLGLWLAYATGAEHLGQSWLLPHSAYAGPYAFFAAGASLYVYRARLRLTTPAFWICVVATLCCLHYGFMRAVLPLGWSYLVLYLAERLPFHRFDRYGDLSYGIYIYAFPIQQIIAASAIRQIGPAASLAATIVLTLPAALLSWHLVEKPALRLKNLQFPAPSAEST